MNAENMTRLLEQEEEHIQDLWSHYLAEVNKLYEASKIVWAKECHMDAEDPRTKTELYDEV